MSAKVIDDSCCYGPVAHHRGKGRCAADQGGRSLEVKLGCFNREIGEEVTDYTYTNADGEEVTIPVFSVDPDIIGFNCINMVDCMMSTDSCGNQIEPSGFSIRHIRVQEPACDPGQLLFHITSPGPTDIFEIPDDVCFWFRIYGT